MPRLARFARPSDRPRSAATTSPKGRPRGAAVREPTPGWSQSTSDAVVRRDVGASIPYELQVTAGYAWRLIVIGVALWGLALVVSVATAVVIPLAVALLLTALLMPFMVALNHKMNLERHAAGAITVVGFLAVVIGLLSLAGTQLVSQATELLDQANVGVDRVTEWLQTGPLHLGGDQISQYVASGREWATENSQILTSGALRAGGTATEFFAGTLIALISTFFFLSEGDRIWSWIVRLMPGIMQDKVHEGFRRGFVSLGSYAKTQCIVAAVDATFITIGAFFLQLPLLIPLGLIIFFGSFIPIIGAFVAGALAVLVALVVNGPVAALIMLGVILAVQQIEGHILQPVLMSKAVALHPLAVILGVGLGSFLFGIVGALFAVPFLAVVNTVVLYWAGHDNFPGLARGMSALGSPVKKLAGEQDDTSPEAVDEAKDADEQMRYIGSASPASIRRPRVSREAAAADR